MLNDLVVIACKIIQNPGLLTNPGCGGKCVAIPLHSNIIELALTPLSL